MSKQLTCPDVSQFQRPLNGDFVGEFVIFRATFGADLIDRNFHANAEAAARLHRDGRLAGALVYGVYTSDPVRAQFDLLWRALGHKVPSWLTGVMLDVETWRGQSYSLAGDHSRSINQLYGLHAHRMGNWNSVIAYGNSGDLQELYRNRDRRCRVIVAAYQSRLTYRKVRGAIGQQYTDGQKSIGVPRLGGRELPRASAPFGYCDHNVFPGLATGNELVRLLRPEQLRNQPAHPARPARPAHTARPAHPSHPARPHHSLHPAHPAAPARPARPVDPVRPARPVSPVRPAHPVAPARPEHPAVHPTAPAVAATTRALTSPNGRHDLVLHDDGTLELRHRTDSRPGPSSPTNGQ